MAVDVEMIYKYTTQKSFFKNLLVRFTQPKFLNDPLECFSRVELADLDSHVDMVIDRNAVEMDRAMQHLRIVGSENRKKFIEDMKKRFSEEYLGTEEFGNDAKTIFQKNINSVVGVFSTTKNPKSLVMWAHYAGNHSGFVIGIDEKHEFFNSERDSKAFGHVREVKYVDRLQAIVLENGKAKYSNDLFFEKLRDWSYEEEWRMLLNYRSADLITGDVHLFKLPESAIKEVIFGMDFPKDEIANCCAKILNLAGEVSFKITQMNSQGEFQVVDLNEFPR